MESSEIFFLLKIKVLKYYEDLYIYFVEMYIYIYLRLVLG